MLATFELHIRPADKFFQLLLLLRRIGQRLFHSLLELLDKCRAGVAWRVDFQHLIDRRIEFPPAGRAAEPTGRPPSAFSGVFAGPAPSCRPNCVATEGRFANIGAGQVQVNPARTAHG